MLVNEVCSYCGFRGDHMLSPKPLTEDWIIACGNCCNVMSLTNLYIVEVLEESIFMPHNWRHQVHIKVVDQSADGGVILYDGEAEQAGTELDDGVYVCTDDIDQTYTIEIRGHSLVEIMPIAPKPGA